MLQYFCIVTVRDCAMMVVLASSQESKAIRSDQ